MVQYIFTPWRDRRELLAVRRQFYPSLDGETRAATPDVEAGQHAAVARVAMWMQRGHCPHMVESTALLMAAVLADDASSGVSSTSRGVTATSSPAISPPGAGSLAGSSTASASYAARATYAAAFSRFVTGLLDGHQDRARKLSMHGLAQTVGLPPGFVELRHQATHEALPALRRLRVAARQALAWIWGYYWVNMEEVEAVEAAAAVTAAETAATAATTASTQGDLRTALLSYFDSSDDATIPFSLVETWGEAKVLAELAAIGAQDEGRSLKCIRLSRKLLQKDGDEVDETTTVNTESKARARTGAAASSQPSSPLPTSPEGKTAKAAETSTGPAPWTMGNLNLSAMRAAMAQSRQALYQGGEGKAEEKAEEQPKDAQEEEGEDAGDVVMAESAVAEETAAAPGPELASRNPRWTRYSGEWTPRPIGVV
ncbi:rRNA-processing protein las1 [Sporothrix stenoceras]|uniref:rRNA-processing protein las1 n=1 Tax=Sporothrix stenoceras TaxID=5173 RepID=A0ABR3Z4H7_9PEZI